MFLLSLTSREGICFKTKFSTSLVKSRSAVSTHDLLVVLEDGKDFHLDMITVGPL